MGIPITTLQGIIEAGGVRPTKLVVDTSVYVDPISFNKTGPDQFRLSLSELYGGYDFIVYWGDGSSESVTCDQNQVPVVTPLVTVPGASTTPGTFTIPTVGSLIPSLVHTYPAAGVYTVSIQQNSTTGLPSISFNDPAGSGGGYPLARKYTDAYKVLELAQWGTTNWQTFSGTFQGCVNMQITATDSNDSHTKHVTNWDRAFTLCKSIVHFPYVNMRAAIDITSCWNQCSSLQTISPDLDFRNVERAVYTWVGTPLISFPAIDMPKVTDISQAWTNCGNLTSFPKINLDSVVTANRAWEDCDSLVSFAAIDFPNCTNFNSTWLRCSSLTSFPLIDTSKGTNFSSTWNGCSSLTSFPLIDTSKGTGFSNTWKGCSSLTGFPALDVEKGTNFTGTWMDCTSMTTFPALNLAAATTVTTAWRNTGIINFPMVTFGPLCTNFFETWRFSPGFISFPNLDLSMGTNFGSAWLFSQQMTSFPAINFAAATSFNRAWETCSSLSSFGLIQCPNVTNFGNAWLNCSSLVNFPTISPIAATTMSFAWNGCPLSTASYDALLANFVAVCVNNGVALGANLAKCSIGQGLVDRTTLTTAPRSWSISDGGTGALTLSVTTTNPGSAATDFVLPLDPAQTYDFTVAWEVGVYETVTNAHASFPNIPHTYPVSGVKTVRVKENVVAGFPKIFFNNGGDRLKLTGLSQWGINRWVNGVGSFYGCANLVATASDSLTAETQYVTDLTDWANGCAKITAASSFRWNSCTNFTRAYKGCSLITALGASMVFTTDPLTMVSAFENCTGLTSARTLPPWNLTNLVDATDMFKGCPGVSSASYGAFLVNLEAVCPNNGVPFHAGGAKYPVTAAAARTALLARTPPWVITDGGPV
jgi:hypothetical protein